MSGRRRHLVTLERRDEALDAYGEPMLRYQEVDSVWASIVAVTAQERLLSQEIKSIVTHRIEIGYADKYAELAAPTRIRYGKKVFDIKSIVDPKGTRRELEIMAEEIT